MATIFSGMLGKAEDALRKRGKKLQEEEDKANGRDKKKKKGEEAAYGKVRLTTQDKMY